MHQPDWFAEVEDMLRPLINLQTFLSVAAVNRHWDKQKVSNTKMSELVAHKTWVCI